MKFEEVLGFHGVALVTDRLEEDARQWAKALDARVLHRSARKIVLGLGPEFFLELRKAPVGALPALPEVHVAVRGLERRGTRLDALGGVSSERTISGTRLVVREFVDSPRGKWRPKRGDDCRIASRGTPPARRLAGPRPGRKT